MAAVVASEMPRSLLRVLIEACAVAEVPDSMPPRLKVLARMVSELSCAATSWVRLTELPRKV